MRGRVGAVLVMVLATASACDDDKPPPPSPTSGPSSVDLVDAPSGGEPVEAIMVRELARARREGRDVLVYVGAEWCEPCKRFHDAAAAGQLDDAFPTLRLIEFDADRDGPRLEAAGCASKLIPLFARPTEKGRCHPDLRHMGGVKGDGAVPFLTTRLKAMLSRGPS